jgi:Spy/CpxP family protein refolding chaperone
MKNSRWLKQMAATAGLVALIGTPALMAQETPQSNPQSQDQSAQMQSDQRREDELAKLNLTDDQKAQVKKIHADMKSQMEVVKSDTTLTTDQRQAKLKQIHKASHEQVLQLLTPDQRQQMKADEKERKAAKQQNGQTPAPQR